MNGLNDDQVVGKIVMAPNVAKVTKIILSALRAKKGRIVEVRDDQIVQTESIV